MLQGPATYSGAMLHGIKLILDLMIRKRQASSTSSKGVSLRKWRRGRKILHPSQTGTKMNAN